MKLSMDAAEAIAKRVTKKLEAWGVPIAVRPGFVIMVSLVLRELRAESKKSAPSNSQQNNPDEESSA